MISVVIPLYNKAPHIAKAIESVLQQTVKPLEIIVVDDGSTDGGGQVAKSFIEKGVSYIYQNNQGVSAARNRGVAVATGEFIAFLDADDWWLPNHLETLSKLINLHPHAKLYSTSFYIQRDRKIYRPRSCYRDGWEGVVQEFFADFSVGLSLVNSITACARRNDLLAIGAFPVGVRRGEDIICWTKLALAGPVAHAEIPTAIYYQDGVNRSDQTRVVEAPGSLVYLSDLMKSNTLAQAQINGVRSLFDRISFFTAAGFGLHGDKKNIREILGLVVNSKRYKLSLLLLILIATPSRLLQLARNFRHPKVQSIQPID